MFALAQVEREGDLKLPRAAAEPLSGGVFGLAGWLTEQRGLSPEPCSSSKASSMFSMDIVPLCGLAVSRPGKSRQLSSLSFSICQKKKKKSFRRL